MTTPTRATTATTATKATNATNARDAMVKAYAAGVLVYVGIFGSLPAFSVFLSHLKP